MPLIDRSGFVPDLWVRLDAADPLPQAGRVIAGLERAHELLAAKPAVEAGVHIPNVADMNDVRPLLDKVALISVDFPSFADGRGFSLAQRLRAEGFAGELRAFGHVIADQFAFALSCGFDTVEISQALAERQPEHQWLEALARYAPPRRLGACDLRPRRAALRSIAPTPPPRTQQTAKQ